MTESPNGSRPAEDGERKTESGKRRYVFFCFRLRFCSKLRTADEPVGLYGLHRRPLHRCSPAAPSDAELILDCQGEIQAT